MYKSSTLKTFSILYYDPRNEKLILKIAALLFLSTSLMAQNTLSKKGQASLKIYKTYFDEDKEIQLKEFSELVGTPSISSIPSHNADVENAAAWIVNKMQSIGLTTAK